MHSRQYASAVQGAHGSSSDCMSTPSGSKSRRRPRSADGGPPRHTAATPASRHALRLRLKIVHASRCGRHPVATNCTERAAAAIAAAAADDDDAADAAAAAALPLPLPPLLPRLPLPVLLLRSLRRLLVAAAASVKLCCSCFRLGRRRLHGARGGSERPIRVATPAAPGAAVAAAGHVFDFCQQRAKLTLTHPHKAIVAI